MKSFKKILWGLLFIFTALLLLFGNVQGDDLWRIPLALILAAVTITSVPSLNFFGIFMPLAGIGVLFPPTSIWHPLYVLLAGLLVSIGFTVLLYPVTRRKWNKWKDGWRDNWQDRVETVATTVSGAVGNVTESVTGAFAPGGDGCAEHMGGEDNFSRVYFGESHKYFDSQNLDKAALFCRFGTLRAYFESAKLAPGGAEIWVECVCGTVDIHIPRWWQIKDEINVNMGGMEEKGRSEFRQGEQSVLTIKGNVRMGSIRIFYV